MSVITIISSQTTSTSNWTGVTTEFSSLYNGLVIDYQLMKDSTDSNVYLTLYLNGIKTNAIQCFYKRNIPLTNQVKANQVCRLIYETGYWLLLKCYDLETIHDVDQIKSHTDESLEHEIPNDEYPILGKENTSTETEFAATRFSGVTLNTSTNTITAEGLIIDKSGITPTNKIIDIPIKYKIKNTKGTIVEENIPIKHISSSSEIKNEGSGVLFGSKGLAVLASGEDYNTLLSSIDGNTEDIYLSSDSSILLYSKKNGLQLDSINFYPITNNTNNLGTSTNKWNTVYATTFNGSVTNAYCNKNTSTAYLIGTYSKITGDDTKSIQFVTDPDITINKGVITAKSIVSKVSGSATKIETTLKSSSVGYLIGAVSKPSSENKKIETSTIIDSGVYLTNNYGVIHATTFEGNATSASVTSIPVLVISSNKTITLSDNGKIIVCSGQRTVTLPKLNVNGINVYIKSTSGVVTINAYNCSIDDYTSTTLEPYECAHYITNGSNWYSMDTSARYQ